MDEYIKKQDAFDAITDLAGKAPTRSAYEAVWKSARALKKIPAADVVPVVHGRWEYDLPTINTYGQLRCSICNWWTLDPSVDRSYSYCPNCGAKMGGVNNG